MKQRAANCFFPASARASWNSVYISLSEPAVMFCRSVSLCYSPGCRFIRRIQRKYESARSENNIAHFSFYESGSFSTRIYVHMNAQNEFIITRDSREARKYIVAKKLYINIVRYIAEISITVYLFVIETED